jgi:hypothetical protein
MPKCIPRLIYVGHTTQCIFKKVTNEIQHLTHVMAILNMLWCHLALPMHLLFSNTLWIMCFMYTWMILWSTTSMTFSYSQRTWQIMNTMYVLCWRSFKKLNFMPIWRNVNSINLKWNSWTTSFLEMTFSWTLVRSRPLLIRLPWLLFKMFNVFLDLPTFIDISLPIILQ